MDYLVFDNYQPSTPLTLPPQKLTTPISEQQFIKKELFDPNYSIPIDDPDLLESEILEPNKPEKLETLSERDYRLLMDVVYEGKQAIVVSASKNNNGQLIYHAGLEFREGRSRTPHHLYKKKISYTWATPSLLLDQMDLIDDNPDTPLNVVILDCDTHDRLHRLSEISQIRFNQVQNLIFIQHVFLLSKALNALRSRVSEDDIHGIIQVRDKLIATQQIPDIVNNLAEV